MAKGTTRLKFFLLLLLSLLTQVSPQCNEQWDILPTGDIEDWQLVDDVSISGGKNLEFTRDPSSSQTGDIGGAAWLPVNLAAKKGVSISFTPEITIDENFYGNAKYPQGFAIVFTTSKISKNLIGSKGSGLGYDGINSAVAFEFDFIQQTDKNDAKNPHFSAHYSLNSAISSITPSGTTEYTNKQFSSNFYDNTKDGFYKDTKITIECIGGYLRLYLSTGEGKSMINAKFPYLEELLENEEVHVGITASMNLYKAVVIKDFEIKTIEKATVGKIELVSSSSVFSVGDSVSFRYKTLSNSCKTSLRIYESEFSKISVTLSKNPKTIEKMKYDSATTSLIITLEPIESEGSYELSVVYDSEINPPEIEISVSAGSIQKLDLCNVDDETPEYDSDYKITIDFPTTSKSFSFFVCSYDQYGNSKSYSGAVNDMIKIGYPDNVVPTSSVSIVDVSSLNKKFNVTVPITRQGEYTIFSSVFRKNMRRYYNVKQTVSYENSKCFIEDYTSKYDSGKEVKLFMKLYDPFGNEINNKDLKETLGCAVTDSKISYKSTKGDETEESVTINDSVELNYPILSYTASKNGKFTFVPKITCKSGNTFQLKCEECTFYVTDGTRNKNLIKLYSDYKQKYYLSSEITEENPLLISFEETNNLVLTKIKLIDSSGLDVYTEEKIGLQQLIFVPTIIKPFGVSQTPDGGFQILMNSEEKRENCFDPFTKYTMKFTIDGVAFSIPFKLVYSDNFMNNVITQGTASGQQAFYKREKSMIEASKSVLLYNVYQVTSENKFIKNNSLDCKYVKLTYNSKEISPICEKQGVFLTVKADLTEASTGELKLLYNNAELAAKAITVVPKSIVNSISFDEKSTKISNYNKDTKTIIFKSVQAGELFTFPIVLLDKYSNKITTNIKEIFDTIFITKSGLSAEANFNGEVIIYSDSNENKNLSITLTLRNSEEYKFQLPIQSTQIDATTSFADLNLNGNSIEVGEDGAEIKVRVFLKDFYSNNITSSFEADKEALTKLTSESLIVYGLRTDFSEYTMFSYEKVGTETSSKYLEYKAKIKKAGEYEIKVFYNNVPIETRGAFIVVKGKSYDSSSTTISILGYKHQIPIFKESENKVQIVKKADDKTLVIKAEFYDSLGNKVSGPNAGVPQLYDEEKKIAQRIFCQVQTEIQSEYIYQVCNETSVLATYNSLADGKYYIRFNSIDYPVYIGSTTTTTEEESSKNSMIMTRSKKIYSKVGLPGTFIIDLRAANNLRLSQIDLDKFGLGITGQEFKSKFFLGPSEGLVTAIAEVDKVGEFSLTVNYNGKPIITGYTYVNKPGRVASLTEVKDSINYYKYGKTVLLQAKDANGNVCGLGELNNEYFLHSLVAAETSEVHYKIERTYNPVSGIIAITFDTFVGGSITISTILSQKNIQVEIPYSATGKEHINIINAYLEQKDVTVGNKAKLIFSVFTNDYKVIKFDKNFNVKEATVDLIRNENDNIEYIGTYEVKTEGDETFAEIPISKSGDYLFIPQYLKRPTSCSYCRITVTQLSPTLDVSKTKVYHKEGNKWIEKDAKTRHSFYKHTFPFFKVELFDTNGARYYATKDTGLDIQISAKNFHIESGATYLDNGDVYIYLTDSGKDAYEKSDQFSAIKLSIQSKDTKVFNAENYVLLYSEKVTSEVSICPYDAVPTITDQTNSYFSVRAGKEAEIEFSLEGCDYQRVTFYGESEFTITKSSKLETKIIPAHKYGHYILFVKGTESGEETIKIKFKQSSETSIKLKIFPGYAIGKTEIGNFKSQNLKDSDLYAYFSVKIYDKYNNPITNESTNKIVNDVFVKPIYKNPKIQGNEQFLPYKMSYNKVESYFICQVPIVGNGEIYFEDPSFTMTVNVAEYYYNSFATMTGDENVKIELTLRDTHYQEIVSASIEYDKEFNFVYTTLNLITGESISIPVTATNEGSTFTITLPENVPKYHYYAIIPYNRQSILECGDCIRTTATQNVIYSVIGSEFTTYLLSKSLNIDHATHYTLLMYESAKSETSVDTGDFKLGKFQSKNILYLGYTSDTIKGVNEGQKTIKIDDVTFTINLKTSTNISTEVPGVTFSRVHSNKGLSYTSGDENISFYFEGRDQNNALSTQTPKLNLPAGASAISVFPTSAKGIYYVVISTTKVFSEEQYKIKLGNDLTTEEIFFIGKSGYPKSFETATWTSSDWNIMESTATSRDENGNVSCDRRANLFMLTDFPQKIEFYFRKEGNSQCRLFVKCTGVGTLKAMVSSVYEIEFTNTARIKKDPFKSTLKISPSSISSESDLIKIELEPRAEDGLPLTTNFDLIVYEYEDALKKSEVYESLISGSKEFRPKDLKMTKGKKYFISAKIDGIEIYQVNSIKYQPKEDLTVSKYSVEMLKDEWSDITTLVTEFSSKTSSRFSLAFPYEFSLQLLNEGDELVPILNQGKLTVYLAEDVSPYNTKVFDFSVLQTDDYTFSITVKKEEINKYIHLPKKDYVIYFLYENSNGKAAPRIFTIDYEDGHFQNSIPSASYGTLPDFPKNFQVISESDRITVSSNYYTKETICLGAIVDNKKIIYSDYLDPVKFSLGGFTNCPNPAFTVSYRGCIDVYLRCESDKELSGTLTYNGTPSTTKIAISSSYKITNPVAEIVTKFPDVVVQNEDEPRMVVKIKDGSNNVNYKYSRRDDFEIYLNDEPLERNAVSVWSTDGSVNIQVSRSYIQYIPTQTIKIYFVTGYKQRVKLENLEKTFKVQQSSIRGVLFSLPLEYKAGDDFSFHIVPKDAAGNCFNVEEEILKNFTAYSEFDSKDDKWKTEIVEISNYNKCPTTIKVSPNSINLRNTLKKTGNQKLFANVTRGSKTDSFTSTLEIYPRPLSPSKTTFFLGTARGYGVPVKVGEETELFLAGKDEFENEVTFTDLIENFDFKIEGLNLKEDYTFKTSVDKTGIKLDLTVNKIGSKESSTYDVKLYFDKEEFSVEPTRGVKSITIKPGECSLVDPNVAIDIEKGYPGDKGLLTIKCKDKFGNYIDSKGNENLSIRVSGGDILNLKPTFKDGLYTSEILFIYEATYIINVYLNGKDYGEPKTVVINSPICGSGQYSCPKDRHCVDDISKCEQIKQSECDDEKKKEGAIYTCKVNGVTEKCQTIDSCDCPDGLEKCDGFCLPKAQNYCTTKIISSCSSVVKVLYPDIPENDIKELNDGTCRVGSEPSKFACPLGYKPCGITCVQFDEECKVNVENCSENQVRCWDLSCATSMSQCPTRKTCTNSNMVMCFDGTCAESSNKCPQTTKLTGYKLPVCPIGQSLCQNNKCQLKCSENDECPKDKPFTCPDGTCTSNEQLCSSEMICPSGYIKCPQGGCSLTQESCIYNEESLGISCPRSKPILCPDLSCVENKSLCTKVPQCPQNAPYKCWNNECRKSLSLCPTKITCPEEYPVLCNNGFCKKSNQQCTDNDDETQGIETVRCFDGSYRTSLSLCPTHVTCNKGLIKCWNEACVESVDECAEPPQDDCADNMHRCPDGTCRDDRKSCGTISICPPERPVKCYDSSCRSHLSSCPEYQSCGVGRKSCPDGTCASQISECNTIITCLPNEAPYLCYDGSCKANLADCPTPPSCDGKFLCPTGICVSNRQNCKFFDACPVKNPVKCDTNSCVKSYSNCEHSVLSECPIGYVSCGDGTCQISEQYCEKPKCPKNLPYKCPEGTCQIDETYCDKENGCPYNRPYKCPGGKCIESLENCEAYNDLKQKCAENKVLCPDGSCANTKEECPLSNGCYSDKPQRCADGTCVNPKSSSCAIPYCDFKNPVQCENGECVKSSSECPSRYREKDLIICQDNMFMCADGRCVKSAVLCRPIISCDSEYTFCGDGSCRVSSDLCPLENYCPKGRNNEGENFSGICLDNTETSSQKMCPNKGNLCETSGECLDEKEQCDGILKTQNGCQENFYRCNDGRCLSSEEACSKVSLSCNEETPFLCPNGQCALNEKACQPGTECVSGLIRCQDGKCVENEDLCINENGCPYNSPLRCEDGSCVSDSSKCPTVVSCKSDKPFICADKTCISDKGGCRISYPCSGTRIKCSSNGYCANSIDECERTDSYCPLATPIKCSNGRCVSKYVECSAGSRTPLCESGEFYCVRKGKCVKTSVECVGEDAAKGKGQHTSRRNLQTLIENGCNEDAPYSCHDGTCVKDRTLCPILPACNIMEYRCPDGTCSKEPCKEENDIQCEGTLHKCEDGLCRSECPAFNGCSLNEFQCTNGMCVKNELECIGYSMCTDPNSPYRCIDGKCVSDYSQCAEVLRLSSVKPISYSFYSLDAIEFTFAFDQKENEVGSIKIPGHSVKLLSNSGNKYGGYGRIEVREVPHSLLYLTNLYNNTKEFLFNVSNGVIGSDGVLGFENAVLSPILNISSSDIKNDLEVPGVLHLEHNIYSNEEDTFNSSDYCLARLKGSTNINENSKWECQVRCETEEQTDFKITQLGVYAVILSPLRTKNVLSSEDSKNFFFDNIKILAIVLGTVVVLSGIVFYIFTRVIRYREKYHQNREKIALLQQQKQEYELMSTDVFGQTLGDNILGLVYTKNCCYSVEENVQKPSGGLEDDVEELERQCHNVEKQNQRLQQNIDNMNEQYKLLANEIEGLKQ